MPAISSYALQYSNLSFGALKASPYDLIVTEGAPLPPAGVTPELTDSQIGKLEAQGRTVVGYVDISVTDDARSYWNPAWTDDGTDLGAPTDAAPDWLKGQPINSFGHIVKFWDPDWQDIVIAQAQDLVSRGYTGVFLDDVGRYFDLIGQPGQPNAHQLADRMMALVDAVSDAVHAINPDAYVVVNGDPYVVTDSTDCASGAAAQAFLAHIDAMLLENASAGDVQAAIDNVGASATLLDLFSTGSSSAKQAEAEDAWTKGLIPYAAPDQGYDSLGRFIGPGTAGDDHITGGDGPNRLSGLGGQDQIAGGAGDDILSGGGGKDVLNGGGGGDVLTGGGGRDLMTGGEGDDVFVFRRLEESKVASPDRILDFAPGDRIDLSGIDADAVTAGDQAFHLGSTAGHVGDIVVTYDAGHNATIVALYVNGDGAVDGVIRLSGDHSGLSAADFVL